MNVDAFLSILTLREEGTVLFRMHILTLFICILAVRPMSALDLLLIFWVAMTFLILILFIMGLIFLILLPVSDIVLK
jgi:hypothetical protein